MADVKISALNALGTSPAADDLIPVVDVTATETKKLRIDELFTNPDVTGTLTADGLTVDGNGDISGYIGIGDGFVSGLTANTLTYQADDHNFKNNANNKSFLTIDGATGDISFFEDTGTTAKFFWDASAESLGIGTTSAGDPITPLVINKSDSSAGYIRFTNSDATSGFYIGLTASEDALLNNQEASNMIFHTSNTEAMRIDSSGNVGIGTTSPVDTGPTYGDLTINGSVGAFISLQSNGSTTGVLQTIGTETRLSTSVASGYLAFRTDTGGAGTEAMRIDSSGNVGIGTTTPLALLHVQGEVGTTNGTAAAPTHTFYGDNDTGMFRAAVDTLALATGGTEAARIDSSGNLLVGTTLTPTNLNSTSTEEGMAIGGDGLVVIANSGQSPLVLNRLTSDGNVLNFNKDGLTVGSIGTDSNSELYISGAGNRGGLGFYDTATGAAIQPVNSDGTISDGDTSLGDSGARIKDLYLSGGVQQSPVTVSSLPAAASSTGYRYMVSDSTVAASGNFGATVAGSGSNVVPVFSDGTNWLIG